MNRQREGRRGLRTRGLKAHESIRVGGRGGEKEKGANVHPANIPFLPDLEKLALKLDL